MSAKRFVSLFTTNYFDWRAKMLIVVDMQKAFPASYAVGYKVIREVKRARSKNEWIMLLEYEHNGRTLTKISKEVKGYPKVIRKTKLEDDGSPAVLHALMRSRRNNNLKGPHVNRIPSVFRVCGVNTYACIIKTVEGLNRFDGKVKVISDACANYCKICKYGKEHLCHNHHKQGLREMKRLKNVKII
jgi:nicotinamidase-related amidase